MSPQMYIMGALLKHGSEKLKEKYLPGIVKGEIRLQAFGVTEPTSGSDTLSIKTSAKKSGNNYIINGQKVWTSRAEYSDLILLLAKSDNSNIRKNNLSLFLIDMRPHLNKEYLHKTNKNNDKSFFNRSFFENLEIHESCLIGSQGGGFEYILDGLNAERILIASECIGDAKYFIDKASKYANERIVFGSQ